MYPAASNTLNVYATNGPNCYPIRLITFKDKLFASTASTLWVSADGEHWIARHRPAPLFFGSTDDSLYLFDLLNGLLESTDRNDYHPIAPLPKEQITAIASFNDVIYAANGTATVFAASSDRRSWTPSTPIRSPDKLTLIASTAAGLYAMSTQSRSAFFMDTTGHSWINFGSIPTDGGVIHELTSLGNHLYTVADHGIYVLDLVHKTWKLLAFPPNSVNIYSLADFNGVRYVGTDRGMFALDPAGALQPLGGLLSRGPVHILNHVQGVEFASTSNGLFESQDLGKTWKPSGTPLDRGVVANGVVRLKDDLWAATDRGLFKRSTNGVAWTEVPINTGTVALTAITVLQDTLVVATKVPVSQQGKSTIYATRDGKMWETLPSVSESGNVTKFATIDNTTFALAGFGAYRLSADRKQWLREDTLGDRAVFNIVPVGQSGLAAVTSDTLYIKTDRRNESLWVAASRPLNNGLDAWVDPVDTEIIVQASGIGLFYSTNTAMPLSQWNFTTRPMVFGTVLAIDPVSSKSGQSKLLLGTDFGVYIVEDNLPRASLVVRQWKRLARSWTAYNSEPWFWFVTSSLGLIGAYLTAALAIFLISWGGLAKWLGTDWLFSLTAKPLAVFPRLLRWALFARYRKRAATLVTSERSHSYYFGLPARLPDGSITEPASTGYELDAAIGKAFANSNVIVVIGKGGSGKSTLLQHLFEGGLKSGLPNSLKGFTPLQVFAADYQTDLVQGVSEALRRRFGMPLDRKGDILRQQMLGGGFFVLFDGLSEIEGERAKNIAEILKIVQDRDMQGCRFLFASRPLKGIPPEVPTVDLLPLNLKVIESVYLPARKDLTSDQTSQVIRQLGIFRDDQIDPLLLTLAIQDSSDNSMSQTTSELFRRYFRSLLRVENAEQETTWQAWKFILETFADWFLLSSGKRGAGMQHRQLILRMTTYQSGTSLLGTVQAIFGLSFVNENVLLDQLAAARVLERGPRWRFQHDLFEEYFAASRIVSLVEDGTPLNLTAWNDTPAGEVFNILDLTKQIAGPELFRLLLSNQLPSGWRDVLSGEPG